MPAENWFTAPATPCSGAGAEREAPLAATERTRPRSAGRRCSSTDSPACSPSSKEASTTVPRSQLRLARPCSASQPASQPALAGSSARAHACPHNPDRHLVLLRVTTRPTEAFTQNFRSHSACQSVRRGTRARSVLALSIQRTKPGTSAPRRLEPRELARPQQPEPPPARAPGRGAVTGGCAHRGAASPPRMPTVEPAPSCGSSRRRGCAPPRGAHPCPRSRGRSAARCGARAAS